MYHPSSDSEEYDEHERQLTPNPALALSQHPQVNRLRAALDEWSPYCCGTVQVPSEACILYYGKNERARRIDLLAASLDALDGLESACDPATFGVDQEDVLDVSYRKASKLDKEHFAINLDIGDTGLLNAIRTSLFPGKDERRPIYAELYKLNVYGKGSFFKSHKDTPRGTTMFGSLVLIFPTAHQGGSLVLRHEGRQWTFDAAEVVSALQHAPRLAYVAFFSDVEHAVEHVTSGHRVTLTYNLFFSDSGLPDLKPGRIDVLQPRNANIPEVQTALASLLADPTFLPEGGTLGFKLRHLYPLPTSFVSHTDDTLDMLAGRLKGADAALHRACTALGLAPTLYTVFEDLDDSGSVNIGDDDVGSESGGQRALVACPRVMKLDTHELDEEAREGRPLWAKLCRNFGGVLLNASPALLDVAEEHGAGIESRSVQWVTLPSDVNRVMTRFVAYGNEPMMGYLYQRICMLVAVGRAGRRGEV